MKPANPQTPPGELLACPFVAGPSWKEPEDDCWTAEIQIVGGDYIVATVHGADQTEVEARQTAVIAALARLAHTKEQAAGVDAIWRKLKQARSVGDPHGWDHWAAQMDAALAPAPASSVGEGKSYCNKCDFYGTPENDGFHLRPKDGKPCNYMAPLAATDRAPAPADLVEALRTAERLLEAYRPFEDIEACQTFPEDRTPEDEILLHDRRQIRQAIAALRSPDDLAKGREK